MKKQFRSYGVPWIYNLQQPKANPRDKKPKQGKKVAKKA